MEIVFKDFRSVFNCSMLWEPFSDFLGFENKLETERFFRILKSRILDLVGQIWWYLVSLQL